MDNNDPINVEYSHIIAASMTEEDMTRFDNAFFDAEVAGCMKFISGLADFLAAKYDPLAVTAALAIVWSDYDTALNGDDECD